MCHFCVVKRCLCVRKQCLHECEQCLRLFARVVCRRGFVCKHLLRSAPARLFPSFRPFRPQSVRRFRRLSVCVSVCVCVWVNLNNGFWGKQWFKQRFKQRFFIRPMLRLNNGLWSKQWFWMDGVGR